MIHVRRALAELDVVRRSGIENSSGAAGEIQLGVRLPPIGEPIVSILGDWRAKHPNVVLVVSEMNDRDLAAPLEKRRLDVALTFGHAVWPHAESTPLYWDRLLAAVPAGHALAEQPSVNCSVAARRTERLSGFPRLDTGPVRGAGAERCFLLCIKGIKADLEIDIRG
jgi:DNA-binding transcriptional LysR family regulator